MLPRGKLDDLDLFHHDRGAGLVVPVGGDGGNLIDDLNALHGVRYLHPYAGGFRLTTRKSQPKNKGSIKAGHLTVKQEIS